MPPQFTKQAFAAASFSLFALVLTPGCGASNAAEPATSPGFRAALTQICNVDALARLDPSSDPIGIDGARNDWMIDHVKDPDAIEFMTFLRVEANKKRSAMLRDAAGAGAHGQCPLADWYEREG